MRTFLRVSTCLAGFWLLSCVSLTVNVYFPTAEIEEAAETIEERIRSGQGSDGIETSALFPQTPRRYGIALRFDVPSASAQDVDLDINSPAIKQVIDSRTERYEKSLEARMDEGTFGEGVGGYLVLRTTTGFDLRTLTQLKKLVKEENDDRLKLYQEILKENDLEINKTNMERVGETFAKAIRKTMKVGHWYQVDAEEDTWEQKKKEDDEQNN